MFKTAGLVVVLALTLPACKSDKKDGGGGAAKKTSAAKGGGDVASMFTGTAPTLPAEIASLKFGQPKADALKAAGADSGYVSSKANDKVSYNLNFEDDKALEKIAVSTDADLAPILTKQWGEPIKTLKEQFWFSPATGTRAYLPDYAKGKAVTFDAYEPVEKLLGETGWELAFAAGKPLHGATLDELKAGWGDALCKFDEEAPKMKEDLAEAEKDSIHRMQDAKRVVRYCAKLPRTIDTSTPYGDEFRFGLDGKVASVFLTFKTYQAPAVAKQLLEFMDKKFGGKPTEIKTTYGTDRYYYDPAKKLRAKVTVGEQSVSLDYSQLLPVAELIGGDKPGFSIEGAHMPVGTFAEIKADDPMHYRQRGTLAALYYPPTELNQQHTEADLLFFDKQKKTYGYRFHIHFGGSEAFGDHVFELLKTKFGEPKEAKGGTDKDKTWNFSKNGRKVSARRVSEQWQITVTK